MVSSRVLTLLLFLRLKITRLMSSTTTSQLSPAQLASIPSRSLPIGPQLTHLLSEFTTLSLNLFAILSSPAPTSTTPIFLAISEVDRKLALLLIYVAEHQEKQRYVDSLVDALKTTETAWRQGTAILHSSIVELSPIILSGANDRVLIEKSKEAALSSATLLSYARLLAPFTSAPPSSLFSAEQKAGGAMDPSGRSLPLGALPPFPTEGIMRRGRLQFGKGGEGELGEVGEVGGEFSFIAVNHFILLIF